MKPRPPSRAAASLVGISPFRFALKNFTETTNKKGTFLNS